MKLEQSFYTRDDVVLIARELIGKVLCTRFEGMLTKGIITETEAYEGITDRASHAYGNRRTARTEIMYREGGTAYVYLCYGIHSLFNVVTSKAGNPHAVLIRSVLPTEGLDIMKLRTNKNSIGAREGMGPGKVASLMGIHYSHSGLSLLEGDHSLIWIEHPDGERISGEIIAGPRIGVDYAGEDAKLPYRFRIV